MSSQPEENRLEASQTLPKVKPLSDEWFVLKFLSRWTADDIRTAIEKNVRLAELASSNQGIAKPLLRIAARYSGRGDVGDLLLWMGIRRPDLYKAIVEREDGVKWLEANIEEIRRMLG